MAGALPEAWPWVFEEPLWAEKSEELGCREGAGASSVNQVISAQTLRIQTVSAHRLTCLHLHDGGPQDGMPSGGHGDAGLCPGAWGLFGQHQDAG